MSDKPKVSLALGSHGGGWWSETKLVRKIQETLRTGNFLCQRIRHGRRRGTELWTERDLYDGKTTGRVSDRYEGMDWETPTPVRPLTETGWSMVGRGRRSRGPKRKRRIQESGKWCNQEITSWHKFKGRRIFVLGTERSPVKKGNHWCREREMSVRRSFFYWMYFTCFFTRVKIRKNSVTTIKVTKILRQVK